MPRAISPTRCGRARHGIRTLRRPASRRPTGAASSRPATRPRPRPARRWPSSARAYWYPLYAFIRRKGHDPEEALDLTQDYFARLLEKGTVAAADPAKGRFRSFLLADCALFLADRRDRDRAAQARRRPVAPLLDRRPRRRGPLPRSSRPTT